MMRKLFMGIAGISFLAIWVGFVYWALMAWAGAGLALVAIVLVIITYIYERDDTKRHEAITRKRNHRG